MTETNENDIQENPEIKKIIEAIKTQKTDTAEEKEARRKNARERLIKILKTSTSPLVALNRTSSIKETEDLPNSFIEGFFDTFNIKKGVKTVFGLTRFKVTNQFVDGLIIFIYLLVLFASLQLVKLELNPAVVSLIVIGIVIIIELIVANTPSLKKFFSNEEKALNFLSNFKSMTHDQIHNSINAINFSSQNLGILLTQAFENRDRIPSYIFKEIIRTNELTVDHLNIIFSPNNLIIFNNDESFIISQLHRFKNELTRDNIKVVYSIFKDNDKIIRTLIATQPDSNVLLSENIPDVRTAKYFDYFQIRQKHKNLRLRFFTLERINRFDSIAIFVIVIGSFLWVLSTIKEPMSTFTDPSSTTVALFAYVTLTPLLISSLINGIFLNPLCNCLRRWHNRYLENRILSVTIDSPTVERGVLAE